MKKLYVRPCMYVVEVETMTLLAGSDGTIHNTCLLYTSPSPRDS